MAAVGWAAGLTAPQFASHGESAGGRTKPWVAHQTSLKAFQAGLHGRSAVRSPVPAQPRASCAKAIGLGDIHLEASLSLGRARLTFCSVVILRTFVGSCPWVLFIPGGPALACSLGQSSGDWRIVAFLSLNTRRRGRLRGPWGIVFFKSFLLAAAGGFCWAPVVMG